MKDMESFYVPKDEIYTRIAVLQKVLQDSGLDGALFVGRMNMYYLTGVIANALLYIRTNGEPKFFVKKSLQRANIESPLNNIYPMRNMKDVASEIGNCAGKKIGFEFMRSTLQVASRIKKQIKAELLPIDSIMAYIRSKKSDYEIGLFRKAGKLQKDLHENIIPLLIKEGKTEKQLAGDILKEMFYGDFDGVCRMNAFEQEIPTPTVVAGIGGASPGVFDGTPGGGWGICPASPFFGSPLIKIKKHSPVMVDLLYGYQGYKTDKSTTYVIGKLPNYMMKAHQFCIDIRDYTAELLVPGAIPSAIYESVLKKVEEAGYEKNFMGIGESQAHFLGHGIGLAVDEYPVLAKRFDKPFENSMIMAIEPKIVFDDGIVGLESTYLVSDNGGEVLNGQNGEVIGI